MIGLIAAAILAVAHPVPALVSADAHTDGKPPHIGTVYDPRPCAHHKHRGCAPIKDTRPCAHHKHRKCAPIPICNHPKRNMCPPPLPSPIDVKL